MPASSVARVGASLAGLWAIAIAQPLFDVLGRAPEFFVAHKADGLDTFLLAGLLAGVGPLALTALIAALARVGRRVVDAVVPVIVGALAGIVAVQLAYRVGASSWSASAAVAVVTMMAVAVAWSRARAFRTFLVVLSPAAFVVPAVFLLGGSMRALTAPDQAPPESIASLRATPIVMIVFDELSLVSLLTERGEINAARYPNVAALAADGVWFRNATTVSEYTRWALPAILTGRFPSPRTVPTPRDHPDTLFSLVGRTHRLEVSEPITAICPPRLCQASDGGRLVRLAGLAADLEVVAAHVFLPPAAREGWPSLTDNWAGFLAADEDLDAGAADRPRPSTPRWRRLWRREYGADHLATATAFIDGISPADPRPTLYFMHTLVTHTPARWLPGGQRIANRQHLPGLRNGTWTDADWVVAAHQHAHLMQAGLADQLIGRVRTRLTEAGLYDQALVVITADHGVSFNPGGPMRALDENNAAEITAVPLIMKLPDAFEHPRRGTVDDSNVETVDILPAVAGVLGATIPWAVDGRSPLEPGSARPDKQVFLDLATTSRRIDADALRKARIRAVRRQTAWFGEDAWPAFTIPELRSLIGRDIGSFGAVEETDETRLTLDRAGVLANVDLNADSLPAQVTGRIQARRDRPGEPFVAVALNGRIVATTRRWPGTVTWMAMLPPAALRQGPNSVELFLVEADQPERLRRAGG
jgi:hypothetical protein